MSINLELTPEEQKIVDDYIAEVEETLTWCQKYCGASAGEYTTDENCPLGEEQECMHSSLWNRKEKLKNNLAAKKLFARKTINDREKVEAEEELETSEV